MYGVLAALVLLGVTAMFSAGLNRAGGASNEAKAGMDIRSLEASKNINALPPTELDPVLFQ